MTVYFIRPVGSEGPVKIGESVDPVRRLRQLDAGSPAPLQIAAQIDGGQTLENRFHALFVGSHIRLEWFSASQKLSDTIDSICAGTFDVDSLPADGGPIRGLQARIAAWEPIDYQYNELWRRYCDRNVLATGWLISARPADKFAKSPAARKQADLKLLADWLDRHAPDSAA